MINRLNLLGSQESIEILESVIIPFYITSGHLLLTIVPFLLVTTKSRTCLGVEEKSI